MPSISHWIETTVELLSGAGIEEARREAVLLLSHVLGREPWRLLLEPDQSVPDPVAARFSALRERRRAREPMAYILGEKEFWGRAFHVGPGVLVPRPETEGVVEVALEKAPAASFLAADVGTGSGCIALSLAAERPQAHLVATDPSTQALVVAARNIARHQMEERVELRRGRGLEPLEDLEARLDLLLSNPPYVAEGDWDTLQPEIRGFEPKEALVSGQAGLDVLRELSREAGRFLRPGGWLILEVGYGQAREVAGWLKAASWATEIRKDLAGIERVVAAQAPLAKVQE